MANSHSSHRLAFERPIYELETRVAKLEKALGEQSSDQPAGDLAERREEISRMRRELADLTRRVYSQLDPWETVQVARHPDRPMTTDYLELAFDEFVELHGDRSFGDDRAIRTGFAKLDEHKVMFIGHQKGKTVKERSACFFGCAHPEGYRKAMNKMELAAKYGMPVICFIDTPGAYPGIGAEERGQSEAIGACLAALSNVGAPVIATIIGEGGSGGALALGLANRVLILEFGCYSVISPEGCAAILWKDGSRSAEAAERLRVTAPDLLTFGIVDEVIDEPPGGAHQDHTLMARRLGDTIQTHLDGLLPLSPQELRDDRYRKFRAIGAFAS